MYKKFFKLLSFPVLFLFVCLFFLFVSNSQANVSSEEKANEILRVCGGSQYLQNCLEKQFKLFSKQHDIFYIKNVLAEVQKSDKVANGCHFLAHVISYEEVLKSRGDLKKVIATLPVDECTGGFIMGAVEGYQMFDKNFNLNANTATEICQNVGDSTNAPGADLTCIHTTGHLLLIEKLGSVDETIEECKLMESKYHYECFSGVFMENIFRRNLQAHNIGETLSWNEQTFKSQVNVCNFYKDLIAKACWRELSHLIIDLSEGEVSLISRWCSLSLVEEYSDECKNHAFRTQVLLDKSM